MNMEDYKAKVIEALKGKSLTKEEFDLLVETAEGTFVPEAVDIFGEHFGLKNNDSELPESFYQACKLFGSEELKKIAAVLKKMKAALEGKNLESFDLACKEYCELAKNKLFRKISQAKSSI